MFRRALSLALVPLMLTSCTTPASERAVNIKVDNCGETIELDYIPENVVLLDPSSVRTLAELEVLENVGAKAGHFRADYFDEDTNEILAKIPTLSDKLDGTGHAQVALDEVFEMEPDLIIGSTDEVNIDTVDGIPLVQEPAFCGEVTNASFEDISPHIDLYTKLFSAVGESVDLKADLAHQITMLDDTVGAGRSVAVIYPGMNGAPMMSHGRDSMANPVVESIGLKNVFADQQERMAPVTIEQLIERNPDIIVLLHSDEPGHKEALTNLPGADSITAVREDKIFEMHQVFADPPTPLAVTGAQKLEEHLRAN